MANGPVNPKLHKDLLLACGWGKEIDVVLLLQQGASVKVQDQVFIEDKQKQEQLTTENCIWLKMI